MLNICGRYNLIASLCSLLSFASFAADLKPNNVRTLQHEGQGDFACFSPCGHLIVIVSNGTAKLWDANDAGLLHTLTQGGVCSLSFSPNGAQIIIESLDGSIEVWDAVSGNLLETQQEGDA